MEMAPLTLKVATPAPIPCVIPQVGPSFPLLPQFEAGWRVLEVFLWRPFLPVSFQGARCLLPLLVSILGCSLDHSVPIASQAQAGLTSTYPRPFLSPGTFIIGTKRPLRRLGDWLIAGILWGQIHGVQVQDHLLWPSPGHLFELRVRFHICEIGVIMAPFCPSFEDDLKKSCTKLPSLPSLTPTFPPGTPWPTLSYAGCPPPLILGLASFFVTP